MIKEQIIEIMPQSIKFLLEPISNEQFNKVEEFRLRVGQPMLLLINNKEYQLNYKGMIRRGEGYRVKREDIESILNFVSGFSLYALQDEIRQGYITIEGGHRIGLVGQAIISEKGVKTLKHIGGLNIRISHEVVGCSEKVMPYLFKGNEVYHTLIVSPPKCGKTTILRDIIRTLSNGYGEYEGFNVGVVDERSEIASCYKGVPQNDVGMRTDVLDNCPKVEGMKMLLRSMAPQVIAVDEIGKEEDMQAIEEVLGAGVAILCTVHGRNLQDCMKKPVLKKMIDNHLFDRIVILSNRHGPGYIEKILDGNMQFKEVRKYD